MSNFPFCVTVENFLVCVPNFKTYIAQLPFEFFVPSHPFFEVLLLSHPLRMFTHNAIATLKLFGASFDCVKEKKCSFEACFQLYKCRMFIIANVIEFFFYWLSKNVLRFGALYCCKISIRVCFNEFDLVYIFAIYVIAVVVRIVSDLPDF